MITSTPSSNAAVAIEFVRRLVTGNFDGLPLASDFTTWTPVNGTIDRHQYQSAARAIASLAPAGLEFVIDGITSEGDRVAVEARCCATLRTGLVYDQHYHFLFLFRVGQIQRLRTHLDTKMVADVILPALSAGEIPTLTLKTQRQ